QPPKTSGNWLRSFLHRSKPAKPDRKGTRAVFKEHLSAIASGCFSTESANFVEKLLLIWRCLADSISL
ncbi:MAG: hypothetical protein NWQ23_14275, partial [Yoonia sp.]|uniref:hypothetical protein n=1 Tax=Yoonia sp. TaxID=2212373 RepID=UPI00273D3996